MFSDHPRDFAANRYVYPVLSRRAHGISIGVNLNLDKACNFDCVYCQVDRTIPGVKTPVEIGPLTAELEAMVDLVWSGRLFEHERFRSAPPQLRRLCDIALSGDGEPTACPNFLEAVAACADVRRRRGLTEVKLVLITNATLFHRGAVRQALATLDANNGEIWAKLDAGSEKLYRQVDRSPIPWQRILDNLTAAARERPIVIQSLFMRMHGAGPSPAEVDDYCNCLKKISAPPGCIKLVQVHTVARRPAEAWVSPLTDDEVDALAGRIHAETGLPTAAYYGAGPITV